MCRGFPQGRRRRRMRAAWRSRFRTSSARCEATLPTASPSRARHHSWCGPTQEPRSLRPQDWEGVEVAIYSNAQGNWVVRFSLDSVESPAGLTVYMNVLLRCNPLVVKLQMSRAVEHWNVMPGDGFLYFALRPPWVKARPTADTFYVLRPEEKLFASRREEIFRSTSAPAADAAAREAKKEARLEAAKEAGESRLEEESKPQVSAMGQSILESSLKRGSRGETR